MTNQLIKDAEDFNRLLKQRGGTMIRKITVNRRCYYAVWVGGVYCGGTNSLKLAKNLVKKLSTIKEAT